MENLDCFKYGMVKFPPCFYLGVFLYYYKKYIRIDKKIFGSYKKCLNLALQITTQ